MSKQKTTMPETKSVQPVVAKSDDGTIQINLTIGFDEIKRVRDEVLKELAKDIEVPGFRKGNAPVEKVKEKIPEQSLLEKILTKILPGKFADVINKNNIKPAIYPKFELIKANENEDWQIKATTCELPEIELGNYKKEIEAIARSKSLWTPGKEKQAKRLTQEEKEQEVIKTLLETKKVNIPKVIIEEEVNAKLSKLLERIEKLGLTLESYLSSIGKDAKILRQEYEKQAQDAVSLDLILSAIAEKEGVNVGEKEINDAINAAQADPNAVKDLNTPERRKLIEVIMKRKIALEKLASIFPENI